MLANFNAILINHFSCLFSCSKSLSSTIKKCNKNEMQLQSFVWFLWHIKFAF